ncbi:hypothetical protein PRIPAC_74916 [Pristionchus pacificus]|uniref:Complex I-MWFE n=1 Tax=Pristionchus pacificus TaxID=54126 RepID=A0A2A6CGM3_PRIPA|nr:hypothetical protein PRIPAC_74916 [Pristionchus pacificus]|eukprot:PDM77238.1 hypothetical protein PRIPAC_43150 [Pristionchus pacificus]
MATRARAAIDKVVGRERRGELQMSERESFFDAWGTEIGGKPAFVMWFEQFYSGMITMAWVAGACYMSYPFNKWDVGRHYRRDYCTPARVALSQRDHRLTGNQYVVKGLEGIPEAQ